MNGYEEIRIDRSFLKTARREKGIYVEIGDESILEHPIDLPSLQDRRRGIVPVEFQAIDDVCKDFWGLKLWYKPQTGDGTYQDGIASSYLVNASVVTNILFFDDLETGLGSLNTTVLSRDGNRPSTDFLDALIKSYNMNIMDFASLVHPFKGRIEVIAHDRIYLAKPGGPIPRVTITRRKCEKEEVKVA